MITNVSYSPTQNHGKIPNNRQQIGFKGGVAKATGGIIGAGANIAGGYTGLLGTSFGLVLQDVVKNASGSRFLELLAGIPSAGLIVGGLCLFVLSGFTSSNMIKGGAELFDNFSNRSPNVSDLLKRAKKSLHK